MKSKIPFFTLQEQFLLHQAELEEAIRRTLDEFTFLRGPQVKKFEDEFARVLKSGNTIATANGTDSLFVSLKALGIGPGDEVITPAFSCVPSVEVISLCQARPVFADVHPTFYTLDPRNLERYVTDRTKAIILVHLYGQAGQLTEILTLCKKHNLYLIEDCAQAHLTRYKDNCVGTFGHTGTFSFYPTKNLGAFGDAGCVVTDDFELAEKVRRIANHGALKKDDHLIEGINSRMDTLQAAVLLTKLPYLTEWNDKRRSNAALYDHFLKTINNAVATPLIVPEAYHTFHIYAIRAKKRDALKDFLASRGIETLIHYPYALHNLPAYKRLAHHPEDFPVANRLQNELLSLPVYPELTREQIEFVCSCILDFYTVHKV